MLFDVHNHGAWGIDDGMPCEEDSKQMLSDAREDGITAIIATPHMVPGQMSAEHLHHMKERMDAYARLARSLGIRVYAGCELFLNGAYLELLDRNYFQTLANSKYILVEFDVRKDIQEVEVEEYLYEISIRGYRVILAHVERYFHRKVDIQRVSRWVQDGHYIQVNRTSVLGMHGERNASNARSLLRERLVHLIASDAHRASGTRICKLSDAYAYVKKNYGHDNAQRLCVLNPQHIVADEAMEAMKQRVSWVQNIWKRGG